MTLKAGTHTRLVQGKLACTNWASQEARKDFQMSDTRNQLVLLNTGQVVERLQGGGVSEGEKPIFIKLTPGSKDYELLQQLLSVLKYDPEKVTPQRIVRIALRQMHQNIFQLVAQRRQNNG